MPFVSLDQEVCYLELRRICILAPATRGTVQHHLCQLVLGFPSLVRPLTPTGPYNIPHTWTLCPGEGVSLLPFVCEHNDSVYGWQADPVIIA